MKFDLSWLTSTTRRLDTFEGSSILCAMGALIECYIWLLEQARTRKTGCRGRHDDVEEQMSCLNNVFVYGFCKVRIRSARCEHPYTLPYIFRPIHPCIRIHICCLLRLYTGTGPSFRTERARVYCCGLDSNPGVSGLSSPRLNWTTQDAKQIELDSSPLWWTNIQVPNTRVNTLNSLMMP